MTMMITKFGPTLSKFFILTIMFHSIRPNEVFTSRKEDNVTISQEHSNTTTKINKKYPPEKMGEGESHTI